MFPGRLTYFYCNRTACPFPPVLVTFAPVDGQVIQTHRRICGNFAKNFPFAVRTYIINGYLFCLYRSFAVHQADFYGGISFEKQHQKTPVHPAGHRRSGVRHFCLFHADKAQADRQRFFGCRIRLAVWLCCRLRLRAFDYSDGLDENGYWSGIKALDYVTLPEDFGSIALKENDLTPTEDELQQQVDNLLNQYTSSQPVTGRAAQSGDVANIDYTGTVDGVAFTGGTATGYDLTLGSGSFIDGFEDQIIGHNVGDTFDVTVTFPDGYGDSTDAEGNTITLSGKEAVFSVTLNSISESVTPELTDDGWTPTLASAMICTPSTSCAATLTMRCMPPTMRTPSWTT